MTTPTIPEEHLTGWPFLALWLGMLVPGAFILSALFRHLGDVLALFF